jgi:sulfate transport system substrate-binding protein
LGSGAQARAIVGGFEADIAALSLEPDLQTIAQAGLIKHDWKQGEHHGIVSGSVVVIGVRPGNPKQIHTWQDLAKLGVEVLTPNVKTSGGAMWNVAAIYGAAIRGHAGVPAGDHAAALKLLTDILRNVKILDRSGRDSMLTFERGVGDAIVTYENEILEGQSKGQKYEAVLPESTILIENPVAVVDANVERHGTRAAAEAFVAFLTTPAAQRAFAEHGYRPVLASVAAESGAKFPVPADLFNVRDLGGWEGLNKTLFAEGAGYDQAIAKRDAP